MRISISSTIVFLSLVMSMALSGQNIPRANFQGPMDAQVNTFNGNLYLERTDVAIPNQDLPLAISFSYNSFRDSTDRGYGYGWSHNYATRYEEIEGGMVLEREHGRRDTFRNNSELLAAPRGIFDVLSKSGTTYTLRDKYGMTYTFGEPAHRYLTQVTNTNGNSLTFAYADTLLTAVTDEAGRSLVLSYDGGHLSQVTDSNFPGGRSWTYSYTGGQQLSCVANPFGDCKSYAYDEQGRMTACVDERGFELAISYGPAGRIRRLRTCITTVEFGYNEAQGRTTITEQNEGEDQLTTHVYDQEGKLIRKTGNCCGYEQTYVYNADNSISSTTDANGFERTGIYDDFGNTVATRDALNEQQQFTFGDLNRLTSFTDKRENRTAFTYDNQGNLTRVNQPLDINLEMAYDAEGNVNAMTNGRGNRTTMTYNGNNDLSQVQYPIGAEDYTYDAAGNLVRTVDANGNATELAYDALNRLEQITDALGNSITYGYDAASNLISEVDANGNLKQYTYDAHNRLTAVTTPIGTTRYGYDELDNLTSITNAEGHTSTFEYDTRSRLIREADAMGFSTHYTYDNNGNVIARLDANMQETRYTYDAQNRLLSKTYPGNTDNYAYDANGNLIRASNDNITYVFTYDALNRLTSKYVEEWDKRISYEYDQNGNRTKMIDPDGGETIYTYDANDRLMTLLNPFGELTQFRYDAGGRMTEQLNFNGTRATYTYDAANRLLMLRNLKSDGAVISSYEYAYDGNGLRTSMREANGGLNLYTYDGENRLTRVVYADGTTEDYTFDRAGNRKQLVRTPDGGTAETINYTYDAADRIMTAGGTRYDFDGNGNMLQKATGNEVISFRWDGENRLVGLVKSGISDNFEYDGMGKKSQFRINGSISRFLHDEDNILNILQEDAPDAYYTNGLLIDHSIAIRQASDSWFFHKDVLNSVVSISNSLESVISTNDFSAYGLFDNSPDQSLPAYTSKLYFAEAELYQYDSRWYSPDIGRFLNKDIFLGVLSVPSSINKYGYVENDPINYVDPFGRFAFFAPFIPIVAKSVLKALVVGTAIAAGKQVLKGEKIACLDYGDVLFGAGLAFFPILSSGKLLRGSAALLNQHVAKGTSSKTLMYLNKWGQKFFKTGVANPKSRFVQENVKQGIKSDLILGGVGATAGFVGKKLINERADGCEDDNDGEQSDGEESDDRSPERREDGREYEIPIIAPIDPNEIVGPEGVPDLKWVKRDATLPYTILFENDPELATAPAQRVVLTHEFDDSVNPFSLRIGDFGFGNFYFQVPEDVSYYDTRLDLRDSLGLFLNVIAGIDQERNLAFWTFESIDPVTGFTASLGADEGFLPVNDTLLGNGEGFVNFTIVPSAAAELGDRIEAQASIIFDQEAAILTNVELNTIDPERPVSQVNTIDTIAPGNYRLGWVANDAGSGVADVTLFVSTNAGPFVAGPSFPQDSLGTYDFRGSPDSTYRFFTLARDRVGNVEVLKAVGEPACMDVSVVSLTNAGADQANGAAEIAVTGNSGTLSYTWEHDGAISGPVADNLLPGDYRVTVRDAAGCVAEAVVTIDQVNSIVASAFAPQVLKIYPVPSRRDITVEYFATSDVSAITIYDLNGRVLLQQTFGSQRERVNTSRLDVGGLPAGHYYLRLTGANGGSSAGRFFKQ